jgi:putative transposase
LAAVEDLYSRRVVGWSMAENLESRLVVDALELAVQRQLLEEELLAHSDRGSQYASEHYQRLLEKHGITCSMSRRGDCWDNAPMESFFASLNKQDERTRFRKSLSDRDLRRVYRRALMRINPWYSMTYGF